MNFLRIIPRNYLIVTFTYGNMKRLSIILDHGIRIVKGLQLPG